MNIAVGRLALAGAVLASFTSPALSATFVNWSSISNFSTTGGITAANATMDVGGTSVAVIYNGGFAFTHIVGDYNYFTQNSPAPYTGGQYNAGSGYVAGEALADAPTDGSLIGLSAPTHVTITFSQAVSDVYMGLVSWNGDGIANFSAPYSLVSSGSGAYGEGAFSNVTTSGFVGNGELHGVIKFAGPITKLDFDTTGDEYWHGLLIGTAGLAPPAVPEPATWAMFIGGFGMIGAAMRRRQRAIVRFG